MTVTDIINYIGGLATIGMGCLGLFFPNAASRFTGLSAKDKTSFAEFRATFGGAFVVIGVIVLVTGDPIAQLAAGGLWVGAAAGRIVSIVVDRGYKERKNLVGVVFEAALGALLLV